MGVQDHDGPPFGVVLLDRCGQRCLGPELDILVQGEDEVVSRHGGHVHVRTLRDERAGWILLHHLAARTAGQEGLVFGLQSRQALAIHPDEAQHLGGQ